MIEWPDRPAWMFSGSLGRTAGLGNYSMIAPPNNIITQSLTITAVSITTETVLITPCWSIQFAMRPGIIFPITATLPNSGGTKIMFLDIYPKMNPRINANTILRLPYKNMIRPNPCMIPQTRIATAKVTPTCKGWFR